MNNTRKSSKLFVTLLLVAGMLTASCALGACSSSKNATMYPTKKYKTSKTVKSNISVRGTNAKNGSTYRSY
ncbi:MAG: hypothetical protein IJK84_10575 [Bacteroidales bacterium]|nr:hypothetical protein [Bacteroidales bacterium]